MNNCILLAEIIQDPQLRYTSDTQTPIAEMLVQFPGLRADDPASTLKVIGWGNLAQEIQEKYHTGDRVVIEGRLGMNTLERPEGFKEKRAELTAQRIHVVGSDTPMADSAPVNPTTAAPTAAPTSQPAWQANASTSAPPQPKVNRTVTTPAKTAPPADFDEIPF
jgi:single-strand DNA-binding protein